MEVYEEEEMNRLQESMERAQAKARRAESRVAELEVSLVLESHRIADDNGSPDMPYCVECEEGWPCEPFQSAEKSRAAAAGKGD